MQHGIGIFFDSIEELSKQLHDRHLMTEVRHKVWDKRMIFTFDAHVDDLIDFFRKVVTHKGAAMRKRADAEKPLESANGNGSGRSVEVEFQHKAKMI